MRASKTRRLLLAVLVVLVVSGGAYAGLTYLGIVPSPTACSTETKLVKRNIAGLDFQITDSDCDTLAKEEFVSVYVSVSDSNRSWIGRLINRKELLFRYYPENWNSPLPSIVAGSQILGGHLKTGHLWSV
jgi:hypothetical protein